MTSLDGSSWSPSASNVGYGGGGRKQNIRILRQDI